MQEIEADYDPGWKLIRVMIPCKLCRTPVQTEVDDRLMRMPVKYCRECKARANDVHPMFDTFHKHNNQLMRGA